jgi:hypothetical protein
MELNYEQDCLKPGRSVEHLKAAIDILYALPAFLHRGADSCINQKIRVFKSGPFMITQCEYIETD